jgi:Putative DNA-binding domain
MDIVSKMKGQKPAGNLITNDIQKASKSLPLEEQKDLSLEELIRKGESDTLEFKSSMMTPTRPEPKIVAIEEQIKSAVDALKKDNMQKVLVEAHKVLEEKLQQEIVKTIAAFLNSEGGILLVGVEDDGTVSGIEKDFKSIHSNRKNLDGWLQYLVDMITNQIGPEFTQYIKVRPISYQNNTVAKIIVTKSGGPAYVEKKDVEFYIRSLNTTRALNTKQANYYIVDHWKI